MPLGLSGAGRLPAINIEHTRSNGALWSSCCALRNNRRRRYPGWNAGSILSTGMALQLHKCKSLVHGYCPVCKHPRWLSASQSITLNPFSLLRRKASPQHTLRGASLLFVSAKSRQKPCDTLTLAKSPLDCPFFSTAGHTLTREPVIVGLSKYLGLLTVCPLARRKKGHRDFATFATVAVRGGDWLLQRSPCSRTKPARRAVSYHQSFAHVLPPQKATRPLQLSPCSRIYVSL